MEVEPGDFTLGHAKGSEQRSQLQRSSTGLKSWSQYNSRWTEQGVLEGNG